MAEKDPLDKLEEQLKCDVCLDSYTDPKVLLCNHAYCKKCIDLLARNRLARNSHSVTCPNCRKVTPIPESGVKSLQPAFRINNLFEIQDSLKKQLKDASPAGAVSYCNVHGDEELKLYCESCDMLICFQCVIKGAKHQKCEYGMLTEVCDRYKRDIKASLEPVKRNLGSIDNAMEKLRSYRGEIGDQCDAIKADIQNSIQKLHETLDSRKAQLYNQLQEIADTKLEALTVQNDRMVAMHAQLKLCQANVEDKLETCSEEELVKAKTVIVREIEESRSFFKPDTLNPSTQADTTFTASSDIVGLCQNYATLSAGEMHPDPVQCYATGPGLEAALVRKESNFTIHGVNSLGVPCEVQVDILDCKLVSEINDRVRSVNICSSERQLVVKYIPVIKGRHQLYIKINGQHIKRSPFTIRVKSTEAVTRDPIATISLDHAWGVAVNHKNEVVVTQRKNHCISVYRPNGEELRSFGTLGSREGQLDHPLGVAVDDKDNIFVADSKNNRIQKFTSGGRFLTAVGGGVLPFKVPRDIAFNSRSKKIYVVDKNSRVQILNLDLSYCGKFGEPGSWQGQLTEPWGISCDSLGRVYVAIYHQSRLQVFTADGTFLRVLGKFGFASWPLGIGIDSSGVVYVSDGNKDRISALTFEGEAISSFGGIFHHGSAIIRGIAVDDCDLLYVCNYDGVSIFS